MDLSAFDLEDFSFWDVNDDSLFTDHDVYLAALGDYELDDTGLPSSASSTAMNSIGENSGSTLPSTNNAGSTGNKKSKQQQQITANKLFLLSKNDKRRTYAKLFSEAFNSGEGKALMNFLESYCTPSCEVIQSCVVKENPYIPKHVEVKGIEAIHSYWVNTFLTIPDCLLVMLETKLRIKNAKPSLLNNKPGEEAIQTVTSAAISRSEGSSIVSSFSFTGTKLYNLDMKGAVTRDTVEENAISTSLAQKGMVTLGNTKQIQALINKSQKNVKKRARDTDWPKNNPSDPSAVSSSTTTSNATATSGNETTSAKGSTTNSSSSAHHDISDRYNIFLHPPRRFSTLAGTPFGGSSNHYYHPPKPAPKNIVKTSDYVEITAATKIEPGPYMETEGHINFLGTLTMFLDGDNKITRFEFLYSHMD